MKYLNLIAILLLYSCNLKNQKQVSNSKPKSIEPTIMSVDYYLTSKETQRHAIFKFDNARDSSLFEHGVKIASLSRNEIAVIEKIISKAIIEYNKTAYKAIKQPEKYFKQLIPVINLNGEKEVWVDCFCGVTTGWKKYRERVNDGGSCFLHFRINLTKNKVMEFYTNGVA